MSFSDLADPRDVLSSLTMAYNLREWTYLRTLSFVAVLLVQLELVNTAMKVFYKWGGKTKVVPVRGKHLDQLDMQDIIFIGCSKMAIPPFIFLLLRWCHHNPTLIPSSLSSVTFLNTLLPLPLLFIIYDLPYSLAHRFLHLHWVYPYIHKHHHKQKAPSRGNLDAVNVHPVEFHIGEYLHWFAVWFLTQLGLKVHLLSIVAFLFLAGVMASLNHTRFDVKWSALGVTWYDPKDHDVHHRLPRTNYGQYIQLWDKVLGTWRGYRDDDRVVKEDQLTGRYEGVSKSSLGKGK
ncbi:hypothetical protein TrRE_jg1008 [Triparma retinervis]|uniref:Fatty acid hydroxylase domain-containing protein n=1 Tax=Triparma retinervis TaxID=2557542 RepID=A0A9W7A120_9STRA|nr:hypothetical protein TrRE_jg1008 [Triparma retinervis]